MANVYFIGNAHLDPVWLWRWQDGVRINGVIYGKQYIEKPGLGTGGVAFYDGNTEKPQTETLASGLTPSI